MSADHVDGDNGSGLKFVGNLVNFLSIWHFVSMFSVHILVNDDVKCQTI
jgi:hypothetical protein